MIYTMLSACELSSQDKRARPRCGERHMMPAARLIPMSAPVAGMCRDHCAVEEFKLLCSQLRDATYDNTHSPTLLYPSPHFCGPSCPRPWWSGQHAHGVMRAMVLGGHTSAEVAWHSSHRPCGTSAAWLHADQNLVAVPGSSLDSRVGVHEYWPRVRFCCAVTKAARLEERIFFPSRHTPYMVSDTKV